MNTIDSLQLRDIFLQNNTQTLAQKNATISNSETAKRDQLKEVGKSFEQIFLNMMLTSMRKTLNKEDDLLYGGMSQDIFEDMLYEKYAEEMVNTNFLSMGDMIVSQYEKYL